MKRSKFSKEQVAYALREVEAGTAVPDVCRHQRGRILLLRVAPRVAGGG